MQQDLDRLKVALRALMAVIELRKPEETDIQALRSCAPLCKRGSPDELAYEVIQHVLKARGRVSEGMKEEFEGPLPDTSIGPATDGNDMGVMNR